jgi:gamma-glutamylaminecyclotransferase
MDQLFVYGSLKEGFPNFHVNRGRRIAGHFVTTVPYPFYLVDGGLPCLLNQPGQGLTVRGQVFEVDSAALAAMDQLERLGEPGGYTRERITVQSLDTGATPHEVWVYCQSPAMLQRPGPHIGPLAEYTHAHAKALRW